MSNLKISNTVIEKEISRKKSKFDFTHDVNTTYGWGEMQPLQCRLVPLGDTKSVFSVDSFVRLSPLVAPTFSRIKLKQFHQFVPMSDIFPWYNEILGDTPVTVQDTSGAQNTVKLTTFPTVLLSHLMIEMLEGSRLSIFTSIDDPTGTISEGESTIASVTKTEFNNNKTALWSKIFSNHAAMSTAHLIDTVEYGLEHPVTDGEGKSHVCWDPSTGDYTFVVRATTPVRPAEQYYIYSFKLSAKGKRFRKILLGLGYQPFFDTDIAVNIFPLLAYYKAYFDLFRLPQYDNYQATTVNKIYQLIKTNGSYRGWTLTAQNYQNEDLGKLFRQLCNDLKECWYSEEANYISSHIGSTMPMQPSGQFASLKYVNADTGAVPESSKFANVAFGQLFLNNQNFSQLDDELLHKMYYWCNKQSQIGYQLREQLIARGYQQFVDECKSNYIGSTTMDITIDPVFSTADTEGAMLGEYAGKGSQGKEGETFSFVNNEIGYIVSMGCIIPEAGYNSALDPALLASDKYTMYNPQFDGFGLEKTPRACVGASYQLEKSGANTMNSTFGHIPRYSGFKQSSNVLNGDMSLGSVRDNYYPYQLDRQILQNTLRTKYRSQAGGSDIYDYLENKHIPFPNAGREWRFPTRYEYLGNFNRIFRNGSVSDQPVSEFDEFDNFLSHNILHYDMYSTMLPISESWDTIEDEDDKDRTITVNK